MKKHDKTRRARVLRRKQERAARKAKKLLHFMAPYDGSEPHLFDDCPICRAMAEMGLAPDADGIVELDEEQAAELRLRQAANIQRDGLPDGAVWVTEGELQRQADAMQAMLEARGFPSDPDEMTDEQLAEVLAHLDEVLADLEGGGDSRKRAKA